jgi:hypothetical protein
MLHVPFRPLLLMLVVTCYLLTACLPEMISSPPMTVIPTPSSPPLVRPIATNPVPDPTLQKQFSAVNLPTSVPSSVVQKTPAMNTIPVSTPLDPKMQALVDQAKVDLAQRLSINSAEVALIEVSFVSWPDSSLGCPKPGMVYTQVMVDGLLIRLKYVDQVYEYHSGGGKSPLFCK